MKSVSRKMIAGGVESRLDWSLDEGGITRKLPYLGLEG